MKRWLGALVVLAACNGQIGDPAAGSSGSGGPDGTPDDPATCELCVGSSYLLRLTRSEYERSLRTVLGDDVVDSLRIDFLPSDGTAGPFASNAFFNVDDDGVEAYRAVAEAAGAEAANHADTLLGCDGSDPACATAFIADIGRQLYRRPLTGDEAATYDALFREFAAAGGVADGVRLVITAMLQAPSFLYRIEVGVPTGRDGVRALTGYELATRLSFFFWRSGPDAALMEAAESGALETRAGIEEQARRMLADERADPMIARFHLEWLGVDELETKTVDEALFPSFESVKFDMIAETEAFVLHVVREEDARLETMLTAPYTFLTPALADHYGLPDDMGGAGLTMVTLPADERAGFLTQAGFIAAHTNDPSSAGVHRGIAVRERFFCQALPPPPPVDTIIDPDPLLSTRQKLEVKTSPAACQGCHALINPVGFTFEHYDAIGRYRTMDGAHPVDASGAAPDTDVAGSLDGALELSRELAESDDVKRCFAQQWLRFALGRPTVAADTRSADEVYRAYVEPGGDVLEMIIAVTTSDSFRHRGIPAE